MRILKLRLWIQLSKKITLTDYMWQFRLKPLGKEITYVRTLRSLVNNINRIPSERNYQVIFTVEFLHNS
jgi:hypothetical protein